MSKDQRTKSRKQTTEEEQKTAQGGQGDPGAPQGGQGEPGAPQGGQGDQGEPSASDEGKQTTKGKASTPVKEKPRWSFPTVNRCPRCRTTDTVTYRTDKNVQYRQCRRAVCRWKYTVMGTKV